jgi:serine-type D-Ala-D-Ala carboxypeptidase
MVKIQFKSLKTCLDKSFAEYIKEKVFPGAAIGISSFIDGEFQRRVFCYGKTDNSENEVKKNTLYDVASLTKPLVTVLSILALREEEKIFWKERLGSLLSFDIPRDKKNINLVHLMSHCSGLPAHRPYYENLIRIPPELRNTKIIEMILKENLLYKPGKKNIYSDLGYILLGNIIEARSGKRLDEFWRQKISIPLSLQDKLLFPKNEEIKETQFASTGYCSLLKKKLYGIVHDDNCRILGGIAGHAGLFGTIEGVLSLCEKILMGYNDQSTHPAFSNDNLRIVLEKRPSSSWTLGFDTPSPVASSSGRYFSKNSVGHLGFTGTSFWIDLQRRICIVFLCNRTFFGEKSEQLKKIRPITHDNIMQKITGGFSIAM